MYHAEHPNERYIPFKEVIAFANPITMPRENTSGRYKNTKRSFCPFHRCVFRRNVAKIFKSTLKLSAYFKGSECSRWQLRWQSCRFLQTHKSRRLIVFQLKQHTFWHIYDRGTSVPPFWPKVLTFVGKNTSN